MSTEYAHGAAFRCLHCGAEYTPTYPCPLGAHRALSGWWRSTHRACAPLAGRPEIEGHVLEPPSPRVVDRILDRRHTSQLRAIQQAVARVHDVPMQTLLGDNRDSKYTLPRMVAMQLCRELTACTITQIADTFNRHHSTVVHAIQRVAGDARLQAEVERLRPLALAALDRTGGVAWSAVLEAR